MAKRLARESATYTTNEQIARKVYRAFKTPSDNDRTGILVFGTGPTSNPNLAQQGGLSFATFALGQVTNFQLMMLKGSELETVATREQFHFETRFRVLPKNFGIYGDEKVFDIEEIVISTDTMSFEDYIQCRKYALVSVGFWHNNDLDDALDFALKLGVKRSQWLDQTLLALENSTGEARAYVDNFVHLTKAELFPTREACSEFYSNEDNFKRLLAGERRDAL